MSAATRPRRDDGECVTGAASRASAGTRETQGRHVATTTAAALLIAALAVAPYLNALHAGLTFDDIPEIRDNPVVTRGIDPLGVLTTTLFGVTYRPFTLLTFAVDHEVAAGNTVWLHGVNVGVHAAVSVLVYALARELLGSPATAMIAAVLFAVHPVHTEAVTSLVGRAELLAALCGLLSLLAAGRALREGRRWRRLGLEAVALVAFVLAVLSKESALTLVLLIPLWRITRRGESLRRGCWRELRALDWLPFVACAALFVCLRAVVVGSWTATKIAPVDNILAFVPVALRVRSAFGVVWDYFGLLNVPLALAADYSYEQVPLVSTWADPRCLAGLAVVVIGITVAARARQPAVSFASAWPLVALLTTANLFVATPTAKAERLLYFPSVGWVLLVAYGCEWLLRQPRYRRITTGVVLGVVVVFGVRTWVRNRVWRDSAAFYSGMAHDAPGSAKARYNFGVLLLQGHAYAAAREQLRRASDIAPWWERPAVAVGLTFERQGATDAAVAWYERALAIVPNSREAHAHLCSLLLRSRRYPAAVRACRRGLRYGSGDAGLLEGLGLSLIGSGAPAQGEAVLRDALALQGDTPETRADLRRYAADVAERKRQPEDRP